MGQQPKDKKNEVPMWAKTGHAKPVTRRDFLAAGIIPFAATMLAPNWLKLLLPEQAQAANMVCPTAAGGLIPFVTLNLAGGAGLGSNFVPMDSAGNMLPSYNKLGLGSAPPIEREFGNVPFAGGGISKFLQGIRQGAPTAIARTAFVAVPNHSQDDSSVNKFDVTGMLAKVGLMGSLLPGLGTNHTSTGLLQWPAVVAPPAPLVVSHFSDITNSLGYASAIGAAFNKNEKSALAKMISNLSATQAQKLASIQTESDLETLVDCAGIKNAELLQSGTAGVDPRLDAAVGSRLSTIWNFANEQDLVFGAMTYNGLKGNAGSINLNMSGFDYHDGTRTSGDAADLKAGIAAGKILETAAVLGQSLFLYVCTDGAVGSVVSDDPTAPFVGDRGTGGVVYMLYFNPAGRPKTSNFQLGSFTAGQVADTTFVSASGPEATAAAIFANYLSVNNKLGLFNAIAGTTINSSLVPSVIKFT